MDWWPILSSKCPEEIEWSPTGDLRARAKGRSWKYGKTGKAEYALTIGNELIENNTDVVLFERKS